MAHVKHEVQIAPSHFDPCIPRAANFRLTEKLAVTHSSALMRYRKTSHGLLKHDEASGKGAVTLGVLCLIEAVDPIHERDECDMLPGEGSPASEQQQDGEAHCAPEPFHPQTLALSRGLCQRRLP